MMKTVFPLVLTIIAVRADFPPSNSLIKEQRSKISTTDSTASLSARNDETLLGSETTNLSENPIRYYSLGNSGNGGSKFANYDNSHSFTSLAAGAILHHKQTADGAFLPNVEVGNSVSYIGSAATTGYQTNANNPAAYSYATSNNQYEQQQDNQHYYHNYESVNRRDYRFKYEVNSPEHDNYFGHREQSHGNQVHGSYYVRLPDGRTQIVQYVADENGYRPEIRYEMSGGGDQRIGGNNIYTTGARISGNNGYSSSVVAASPPGSEYYHPQPSPVLNGIVNSATHENYENNGLLTGNSYSSSPALTLRSIKKNAISLRNQRNQFRGNRRYH